MSVKNMWARCGLLALVVGVVAGAAAWAVNGQQPDEQEASPQETPRYKAVIRGKTDSDIRDPDPVSTAKEEVSDPALAEILEIRRRLGDDPFRGTIFEGAATAADGSNSDPATNPEKEFNRAFSDALKTVAASQRETQTVAEPGPESRVRVSQDSSDADFVGALRQAARALDNKAAELEPLRQYGQADQLRRLAKKLRRRAREYDGPYPIDR